MSWDEKAEDYAQETGLSREAVAVAARWQRDQLRTNEAIERVAGLFSGWIGCPECAYSHASICDRCKDFAEWAITALIGER